MVGLLRRLWRDERGVILPYVTIMLVVFVGTAALALDGARYMSLQSQMQKAADALAVAGAAELDRLTNSTTRARNAINNGIVSNAKIIGSGNVAVSSIRFLSSLPASDNTAIASGNVTCTTTCTNAQSIASRFVEVTVTPATLQTIMPVRYLNPQFSSTLTTGAKLRWCIGAHIAYNMVPAAFIVIFLK